jgi:hypothetical protein
MTTAPPSDQVRLLDVQALDTRLAQLAHRRRTLPQHAALAELTARERGLRDRLVVARTELSDLGRQLSTAEEGVRQVRERAERNRARLEAGAGAKDTAALERDLTALARRQGDLEEVELEVMERLEQAQSTARALTEEELEAAAQRAALEAARAAALGEVDDEARAVAERRAAAVAGVDAALVALYERLRASTGLGAAALQGGQCGACRTQYSVTELARVRAEPADAVVRCEECERILVRTGDDAGAPGAR